MRKLSPEEFKARKSGTIRLEVILRDGVKCHYCNCRTLDGPLVEIPIDIRRTLDHIVPASYGGPFTADNLVIACHKCNGRKANTLWPTHCSFCALAYSLFPPIESRVLEADP